MGSAATPPRLIRFGVFELDLHSGELLKQGRKIRLEGQPVQILICLLESPGELVTREDLHRKLWPADTFVNFEQSLNAAVKRLRQALSDSAENPRFVETLPRRGYRFIAPVQPVNPSQETVREDPPPPIPPPPPSPEPEHRSPAWKWIGAALLAILASFAAWMLRPTNQPAPPIRALAVLPLENLSGDPSQDYFSDGMTEELITDLGQIGELRVISRTSVMAYKGAHQSLPQIARDLNVDAIVEGAVRRSGNQVRITAQLILAPADKHLWAQSYEGDLRDVLALQKQVARSIAAEIRVKLTPHEQDVLKTAKQVDPAACEAYLKGRYFWNKRTAADLKQALDYFNQALAINPDFARPYTGLADTYALMGDWEYGAMPPKDAYAKAKAAATKALELDNSLSEAHISLAFCLDTFDWDWDAAGREFRRGIELNPGYATAHHWYAWHLAAVGRPGEAIAEMQKARAIDPLSLVIGSELAEQFLIAHRYDDAVKQSRKTMALDPFFALAHYELGQALVQQHSYGEAIAEIQKAIELSGESTTLNSNLAYAYAVSGRKKEAMAILNELQNPSRHTVSNAPEIALIYVGLNDHDQAIAWLERAYTERFNPSVLLRPAFDPLRTDPRFRDLVRRIGITQSVSADERR
jgi:TolB-like protein/DNA-binding winged helix-turn-helix (wHTH) protein/Tfp pilus assembly protein PilF